MAHTHFSPMGSEYTHTYIQKKNKEKHFSPSVPSVLHINVKVSILLTNKNKTKQNKTQDRGRNRKTDNPEEQERQEVGVQLTTKGFKRSRSHEMKQKKWTPQGHEGLRDLTGEQNTWRQERKRSTCSISGRAGMEVDWNSGTLQVLPEGGY